MISFDIVVAIDSKNGIGKNGELPWRLSGDMGHFKDVTTRTSSADKKNAVIMGRKTWESIPERFRPLPERLNIVLSHQKNLNLPSDVRCFDNFTKAIDLAAQKNEEGSIESIFVIGGQQIFESAINLPQSRRLIITHILKNFQCDVFFPSFSQSYELSGTSERIKEEGVEYYFAEYLHNNSKIDL